MKAYEPKLDPNEETALKHLESDREAVYKSMVAKGASPRESIDKAKDVV